MSISMRTFITIIALVTSGLLALSLLSMTRPANETLALAALFVPVMAVATMYPLHFDFKTTVALDTTIIFAAVLLFDSAIAMLAIGSGAVIGLLLRRRHIQEIVFNSSQLMLQAGVGGQILAWSDQDISLAAMDVGSYAVLAIVASSIYLINTTLTSLIISHQSGLNAVRIWLQSATRHDTIEQISQFVMGMIAAYQIQSAPWSLPLLVFPLLVIYLSLNRWMQLRHETVEAVQALSDLVDLRDPYTYNHARRVAAFAREIATEMGLDYDEIALIEQAGRVHDLGKIIIDRTLLAKTGRMTDEEWKEFETHPVMGAQMLAKFPEFAAGVNLVRHHHERIDGNGYPDRLRGDEIPLGARILAVADAFDAMASARPYRPPLSRESVFSEFERGRGTQWDTEVVASLLRLIESGRIVFPGAQDHAYIVDGSGQIVSFSPAPPPAAAAVA